MTDPFITREAGRSTRQGRQSEAEAAFWPARPVEAHRADDRDLVIAHLGDLLAYQIGRADKAETELAAARAEIRRLQAQAADRLHDC